MSEAALEVRHLEKRFAADARFVGRRSYVHAVDDVSFTLRPGSITALVGESGSGKSTVARLLARLHAPTAGSVIYRGKDIARDRSRRSILKYRSEVQMIFQDPFGSLNPVKTIRHHLERPLRIHGIVDRDELEERVHELLRTVGLVPPGHVADKYPHELSGGQRQRVSLARALAARPGVILLDEPFGAVDAITRADLQASFAEVRRELGVTTLLVTHDLAEAARLADEIAVMRAGRVEQCADVDTLLRAPATDYVEALFARAIAAAAKLRPA
jgi:peptide/nickel transport system ATP-binding protein